MDTNQDPHLDKALDTISVAPPEPGEGQDATSDTGTATPEVREASRRTVKGSGARRRQARRRAGRKLSRLRSGFRDAAGPCRPGAFVRL
jgi:hypothetical protein